MFVVELFDVICKVVYVGGDFGLVFFDMINRVNLVLGRGCIEVINLCGEVLLLFYELCNFGLINFVWMFVDGCVDWDWFEEVVGVVVWFFDDVIDVSCYFFFELGEVVCVICKIGLGVMGLVELFVVLGILYDSEEVVWLVIWFMCCI